MMPFAERLAMAERHVKNGRAVIERQRQLVSLQTARGRHTASSQHLLEQFERSQAIFEQDLAWLKAEGSSA